jgi:hypothetical protein
MLFFAHAGMTKKGACASFVVHGNDGRGRWNDIGGCCNDGIIFYAEIVKFWISLKL